MKFRTLLKAGLLIGLLAGCGVTDICAGKTIYFENPATPIWLAQNDRPALEAIVVNNETREFAGCKEN
jgi:hypothetical protein